MVDLGEGPGPHRYDRTDRHPGGHELVAGGGCRRTRQCVAGPRGGGQDPEPSGRLPARVEQCLGLSQHPDHGTHLRPVLVHAVALRRCPVTARRLARNPGRATSVASYQSYFLAGPFLLWLHARRWRDTIPWMATAGATGFFWFGLAAHLNGKTGVAGFIEYLTTQHDADYWGFFRLGQTARVPIGFASAVAIPWPSRHWPGLLAGFAQLSWVWKILCVSQVLLLWLLAGAALVASPRNPLRAYRWPLLPQSPILETLAPARRAHPTPRRPRCLRPELGPMGPCGSPFHPDRSECSPVAHRTPPKGLAWIARRRGHRRIHPKDRPADL